MDVKIKKPVNAKSTDPYFIELIDETHTTIRQNKGSSFQGPFLGHGVPLDVSSQPHSACPLPSCEHRAQGSLLYVFQELRFGSSRIAAHKNVYITSELMFTALKEIKEYKSSSRNRTFLSMNIYLKP